MTLIFLNCCGAKHQLFHAEENNENNRTRENVKENGMLGFLMNPGEPFDVEILEEDCNIPHEY